MALFLSFRILNIADMTTDGCFVLGAAVSVTLAAAGHPILAIPAAMAGGQLRRVRHRLFADPAGGALHSGGHRHQHGPVHRQPDGDGLESQPEPAGQAARSSPCCGTAASAATGTSCCWRLLSPFWQACCCWHFWEPGMGLSIRATGDNPRHGAGLVPEPGVHHHGGTVRIQRPDSPFRGHGGPVSKDGGHQLRHRHRGHRPGLPHHR